MEELSAEIEQISRVVGKYFPIYETRVTPNLFSFFVRVDETTLEDKFDQLRMEMTPLRYVPILTMESGEQVIHVQKRPPAAYRSTRVNLMLLILTIGTTIFAGMIHWAGYEGIPLYSLRALAFGSLFFAFPLLAILATHEFGHYYMAKRHKVAASLPFFIPSFPPLGTFGAVISMRDPIPNRKALLDIGIAGPIFGLIVSIPVTAIGLYLTGIGAKPLPPNLGEGGGLVFFPPILFQALEAVIPIPSGVISHPTVFAGWVGLFVTALNLIPAGQLDGGHIARALLGRNSTYLSYGALMALFVFGFLYFGWMIIALLILLLGAQHPPPLNDLSGLDLKRKVVGSSAALILVLCFVIVPVAQIPIISDFEFRESGDPSEVLTYEELNVSADMIYNYSFYINNTGNVQENITLGTVINRSMIRDGWDALFVIRTKLGETEEIEGYAQLNASEDTNMTLRIYIPAGATPGNYTIEIMGIVSEFGFPERSFELLIRVQ
ncbi:MAG: site-2 protease family protein [Methanobacteriota archaeon]|nr:MAG: site-2 protease family protein [Euryarchaeota archaeon]